MKLFEWILSLVWCGTSIAGCASFGEPIYLRDSKQEQPYVTGMGRAEGVVRNTVVLDDVLHELIWTHDEEVLKTATQVVELSLIHI